LALWERGEALAKLCEQYLAGARERIDTALASVKDAPGLKFALRVALLHWKAPKRQHHPRIWMMLPPKPSPRYASDNSPQCATSYL